MAVGDHEKISLVANSAIGYISTSMARRPIDLGATDMSLVDIKVEIEERRISYRPQVFA